MYCPILRGRQNELIAVRELAEAGKLENVVPVIEPVKASSTLLKTLEAVSERGSQCYVILNPAVGIFEREIQLNPSYEERFLGIMERRDPLRPCLRLNREIEELLQKYEYLDDSPAVFFDRTYGDEYAKAFRGRSLPSVVFIDDASRRHARGADKVLVGDRFKAKERNADYRDCPDEFFTEDHLYFREESYSGFGDYSVVGERFIEGGFRPKTVAIHCVYEREGTDELYVYHAVSAPDAPPDTAALYRDALENLLAWAEPRGLLDDPTEGMRQFKASYDSASFPGLGLVKKWSIMHHLELVNRMLGRGV